MVLRQDEGAGAGVVEHPPELALDLPGDPAPQDPVAVPQSDGGLLGAATGTLGLVGLGGGEYPVEDLLVGQGGGHSIPHGRDQRRSCTSINDPPLPVHDTGTSAGGVCGGTECRNCTPPIASQAFAHPVTTICSCSG